METKKSFTPISVTQILLLLMSFLIARSCLESSTTREVSFSEFKQLLTQNAIADVTISGEKIKGEFKQPQAGKKRFQTYLVKPELSQLLDQYQIPYQSLGESISLGTVIAYLLPPLFFLLLGLMLFRGTGKTTGGGSFLTIGKSKAKIYVEKDTKITFADVAGADEALEELREVIDFLKNAEKIKRLGGKMPKGVLLVGAPGTGKTLIAKALAGEAGVPFFSTNGAEFVEMFVGVGAARVRDLFEQAKKSAPCIIFIDELDALGKTRQVSPIGGNDEKEQTLNQLLVEMDGFDTTGGIIILAATNRPELIDPALLRAGRFDRQVVVDKPDKKGREEILNIHLKKVFVDKDLSKEAIAGLTPGFTGADLANLVNEAALIATRQSAEKVQLEHFTLALERMMAGLEKKHRLLNPREKQIVAYHEMGHALVGYAFGGDSKIHKVSIIPRGIGAMGYTIQRPTEDRFIMTRAELEHRLTMLMAGRAAETLIFSELSTGAADDLARATAIARDMTMRYGMGQDLGFVTYDDSSPSFLEVRQKLARPEYADETAREIDLNIKKIISHAYHLAFHYLKEHRAILEAATKALLENETLNEEQLKVFFEQLTDLKPKEDHLMLPLMS